jgi:hypothetical protein
MKRPSNTTTVRRGVALHFAVAAGALLTCLSTQAQIISLNLTDFTNDVQRIDADETYGVRGLGTVVGGWVNLNRTLTATNLAFSDGSASTVDVSMTAPNGWGSGVVGVNDTPLKGFLDDYTATVNPTTLTLSQLSTSFPLGYYAIVYLSGFDSNDGASISDGTATFFYQTVNFAVNTWDGTLVQTTTTTDLGSGNAPVAQYAVFGSPASPRSADSVTFTLDTLYGGGAGLGGVQIVAVPEPAAGMILAVGLGLLALARRWRRS